MIYLVRQGQTDWNLLKRFNGCTDLKLNKTGMDQAKALSEKMKNVIFDACYCSPQKRALQTCEIIFKGTIFMDERLSEINCGEFEGTEETEETMKLFWKAITIGDKGTENFNDFISRNCDFCNMITNGYKGKNILIVTHAANARVINYCFNGKPKGYDFNKSVVPNGEVLIFQN